MNKSIAFQLFTTMMWICTLWLGVIAAYSLFDASQAFSRTMTMLEASNSIREKTTLDSWLRCMQSDSCGGAFASQWLRSVSKQSIVLLTFPIFTLLLLKFFGDLVRSRQTPQISTMSRRAASVPAHSLPHRSGAALRDPFYALKSLELYTLTRSLLENPYVVNRLATHHQLERASLIFDFKVSNAVPVGDVGRVKSSVPSFRSVDARLNLNRVPPEMLMSLLEWLFPDLKSSDPKMYLFVSTLFQKLPCSDIENFADLVRILSDDANTSEGSGEPKALSLVSNWDSASLREYTLRSKVLFSALARNDLAVRTAQAHQNGLTPMLIDLGDNLENFCVVMRAVTFFALYHRKIQALPEEIALYLDFQDVNPSADGVRLMQLLSQDERIAILVRFVRYPSGCSLFSTKLVERETLPAPMRISRNDGLLIENARQRWINYDH
jgi:hypothetical protein